ncbi:hypothetical protein [Marinicellulosiphila megalodicopiae]|uniref:hypothetical protein n=1 Tax=Marinicellulosiphila megalodicopiae TaxID=2724896 RepID=UPI003BAF035E
MKTTPDFGGTPEHKNLRRADYVQWKALNNEKALPEDQWSKKYDVAVNQANKSHQAVEVFANNNGFTKANGWTKEHTFTLKGKDVKGMDADQVTDRRLDLYNEKTNTGYEHKRGDQYLTAENKSEILRDAQLMKDNKDLNIKWQFDKHASKPLQDFLRQHNIQFNIGM